MKLKNKFKIITYIILIAVGAITLASHQNSDKLFITGTVIFLIGIIMLWAEINIIIQEIIIINYNKGLEKGINQGALNEIQLFESEEKYHQANKTIKNRASIILIRDERNGLYNIIAKNRWGSKGKIISNAWLDKQ